MKKLLSHDELLDITESFMEKTGLRKYCSKVCRGSCCSGCYDSDEACHKNEGRRLACTLFVCYNLRLRIFTKLQRIAYANMFHIFDEHMCGPFYGLSMYFDPIPKEHTDKLEFPSKYFKFFESKRLIKGIPNKIPKQRVVT